MVSFSFNNLLYVVKPRTSWTTDSNDILTYNPILKEWTILDTVPDLCKPQGNGIAPYEVEVLAKEPIAPTIKVAPLGWTDTRPET